MSRTNGGPTVHLLELDRERTGATSRRVLYEVVDGGGEHIVYVVVGLSYSAMSALDVDEDGAEIVILERAPDHIMRAHRSGELTDPDARWVDNDTVVRDITWYDLTPEERGEDE